VYVSRADSLGGIFADMEALGRVLEREPAARSLIAGLRARLARTAARVAGRDATRCAVFVWPGPLVVAARRGNHVSDLLAAAGGVNLVDDASQPFPTYSTERLIAKAPQVLLVGTHATGAPALEPLLSLASIPAVRDKRVHLVDGDILFRPGPRVVDGVEALARLLHPELYGDGGAP
jgi:iron complex transport system substrate-binding protein